MQSAGSGAIVPSVGAQHFIAHLAATATVTGQPISLDSVILIDVFGGTDPQALLVDPLLRDPSVPIAVSMIALSELVTRPAMLGDQTRLNAIVAALFAFPNLTVVSFDQDIAVETAHVRAETNLRLPDAAIVATARRVNASALIGNDRQWRTRRLGVPYYLMDDVLALP